MKKLLVLTAAFMLFFALMAQQRPVQESQTRLETEKTCRDWKEAGKCPRVTERTSCRELIEQGRCPLHNARQAAANAEPRSQCPRSQGATTCCQHRRGGNTEEISQSAENTTKEAPRRRGRRANRTR